MLELRPVCENCRASRPPESTEARICSFECTFCRTCVEGLLSGVCPNCGGGFVPRPIRPGRDWKGGHYTGRCPPAAQEKVRPVDLAAHAALVRSVVAIPLAYPGPSSSPRTPDPGSHACTYPTCAASWSTNSARYASSSRLKPNEESLWRMAGEIRNSVGNLAVHQARGPRFLIDDVLGNMPHDRDRHAEFTRTVPHADLLAEIDAAVEAVDTAPSCLAGFLDAGRSLSSFVGCCVPSHRKPI